MHRPRGAFPGGRRRQQQARRHEQGLVASGHANGTISAHVHGDGAYITERQGKDEAVVRFLTAKEARALDRHLRRLFRH